MSTREAVVNGPNREITRDPTEAQNKRKKKSSRLLSDKQFSGLWPDQSNLRIRSRASRGHQKTLSQPIKVDVPDGIFYINSVSSMKYNLMDFFFHRLAPDLLNGGLLNGGNPLSGFPLENDTRWRSHGGPNGRFSPRPIMSTGMLRTDLMPRS